MLQSDGVYEAYLPGVIFIETYISQKTNNGVGESLGKIGNLYRDGVRGKMGVLFLEANLRFHFLPPLERASEWFEFVRQL